MTVLALVALQDVLMRAQAEGYAVPAFDVMDYLSADAVLDAAQNANLPVILQIPDPALMYMDLSYLLRHIICRAREASIPVVLHLDHGKSLKSVIKSVHSGFSSVMLDASDLPLAENISATKQASQFAHMAGVSIEGELGHVGGGGLTANEADSSLYTDPSEAARFVADTDVDALAVAIGTVHGPYRGTPKLDFDRLAEIRKAVSVPLVLHGGSGLSDDDFLSAIRGGITKINIFTELTTGASAAALAHAKEKENRLYFSELLLAGAAATRKIAERYLMLFQNKL